VANAESAVGAGTVVLPGLTYTPGGLLLVRFDVAGEGTTTLRAKAWLDGTPEPEAWSIERSDDTAVLQGPGAVGVSTYLAGSATRPSRLDVDGLWVGPSGTRRPA
jgi:hypothetical protein